MHGFVKFTYVRKLITTQLSSFLGAFFRFRYKKLVQKYFSSGYIYNHPNFHLKWFPTTTGNILYNVVAYSFTYTMVSAQFLTQSWDTFMYNYSPYCGILLSRLQAL